MAKIKFREDLRLSKHNKEQLLVINKIIEEYAAEGYKLTLRQLYYQLVSRDIIANQVREYAKLSNLLVKGRMAGVVDWDAIEDRVRRPFLPYWCEDVPDAINDITNSYRLDRQKDQDTYIEVWVEKDALSGVLRRITSEFHVNLMVNRGYSSCTAMYDAAKRMKNAMCNDKECHILYLGDHDPSGLDMVRDIRDRLAEFGVDVTVKAIGLTTEQVKKYNPPPNPAKITDPRAGAYIREHGRVSWEVDALNPKTLHALVRSNVTALIDMDKFNKIVEQEEEDKKKLTRIAVEYEED
ncbi:MAG: hypothetical protein WC444_06670 [Candidatus Paceibacterota bacterium]